VSAIDNSCNELFAEIRAAEQVLLFHLPRPPLLENSFTRIDIRVSLLSEHLEAVEW
jgi:hypothetical protein